MSDVLLALGIVVIFFSGYCHGAWCERARQNERRRLTQLVDRDRAMLRSYVRSFKNDQKVLTILHKRMKVDGN